MLTTTLILAGALASVPQSPEQRLAGRVDQAKELANVYNVRQYFDVAPDGSAIGFVMPAGGGRVLDVATGKLRDAGGGRDVESIALGPHGNVWLGLADGRVLKLDQHGETMQEVKLLERDRIDGLYLRGGNLAWSSTEGDQGGVLEAATGNELTRFEKVTGLMNTQWRLPRVLLSEDGHVAVFGGRTIVLDPKMRRRKEVIRVCDARTGNELQELEPYQSHGWPGFALGNNRLYFGSRSGRGRKWAIEELDLANSNMSYVDNDVRGGQYLDLRLSPSGNLLLEGDFEERDGVMLYDMTNGRENMAEIGGRRSGKRDIVPVGFVGADRVELAATSAGEGRKGITLWASDGTQIQADLTPWQGLVVDRIGSVGNHHVWASWWTQINERVVWHVGLYQLGR